jgi:hypothetical protein
MFEKETEHMISTMVTRTLGIRGHITMRELLAADIPPCVQHYFYCAVEQKLRREWKQFEATSHFPYAHPHVKQLQLEMVSLLVMHYQFSRNDFLSMAEDTIHLMVNYLVRPQWTLTNFLFNNKENIPVHLLLEGVENFSEYRYYHTIIAGVLDVQKKTYCSVDEFSALLTRIDAEFCQRRNTEEMLQLLAPLFALMNYGNESSSQQIETQALLKFFEEKKLNSVTARLSADDREYLSFADVREVLEYVAITHKGFFAAQVMEEVVSTMDTLPSFEEYTLSETILQSAPSEEEVLALLKKPSNVPLQQFDDVVLEIEEEMKNEEPPASYTVPSAPVQTTETNDIRDYITERYHKKFIKKIFKRDGDAYEQAMDTLNGFSSWGEAKRSVGDIFTYNDVDPYSSIAIKFSEIVYSRFLKM